VIQAVIRRATIVGCSATPAGTLVLAAGLARLVVLLVRGGRAGPLAVRKGNSRRDGLRDRSTNLVTSSG